MTTAAQSVPAPSRTAASRALHGILGQIAEGAFQPGDTLPSDAALAAELDISRLSVREAISMLAADGAVEVRQGRRSRLAPLESWSPLNPDLMRLRYLLSPDADDLLGQLLEARGVLETEIARLAAPRITDAQLAQMEEELATMRAHLDSDDGQSARADIRFHDVLVRACGNAYLAAAFEPLSRILLAVRLRTSSTRDVRAHAIHWHGEILAAMRAHDADEAVRCMREHMAQTLQAMERVAPESITSAL